jgi:ankyrin repeat protein
VPGGGNVVRALVRAGAQVDARTDAKRCTALHLAARRGNTEVADALLNCGADINARDKTGDTPLQRARNCRKAAVAALLAARGAKSGG